MALSKGLGLPTTFYFALSAHTTAQLSNSHLFSFYHYPQSRGITCLLDMKSSFFGLSQAKRKDTTCFRNVSNSDSEQATVQNFDREITRYYSNISNFVTHDPTTTYVWRAQRVLL